MTQRHNYTETQRHKDTKLLLHNSTIPKTVKMPVTLLRHIAKRHPVKLSANQNARTQQNKIMDPLKKKFTPCQKLDCWLTGEALYYSTIYPNCCDWGTAEELAVG